MPGDIHPERADRDHYAVLGVPPSASHDEILRAYRRLARSIHPDIDAGNPAATERFERLATARDVLADPASRAAYDRARRPDAPPPTQQPTPRSPRPRRANRSRGPAVRPGPVIWTPDRPPGSGRPARPQEEPW